MNETLRRLLDIDQIPADVPAGALRFGWEHPIPGWAWGIIIFLGGVFVFWSYSRLEGARVGRAVLAGIRSLVLFVILLIIVGPTLVYPREHVENDRVFMLVDRSQSMTVADGHNAQGSELSTEADARLTRDARLREVLRSAQPGFMKIAEEHEINWLGFDAGAYPLAPSSDTDTTPGAEVEPSQVEQAETGAALLARLPELGAPDGALTALGPALAQTMRYAAARPVTGIVIFSDGRTSQPPGRDVLRRLQADSIQVFVVPLGSDRPIGDLAIESIEAPQRAFLRDKVPVRVHLEQLGAAAVTSRAGATIRLIDERTGEVLDQNRVESGSSDDQSAIILNATPDEPGVARWTVRIEPDVPDLVPENNEQLIEIDLVDRPIRVLYIDGLPRWDFRFFKSITIRESTIDSSAMLVSADRDFAQEGNTPISRLPNSPEEFEPYDVIVIGDVHADFFSPRQLEMIRDQVAENGAGLLWMVGPRANPATYASTALEALLPIRANAVPLVRPIGVGMSVEPTLTARSLGVLQLIDQDGTDAWNTLSDTSLTWAQLQWALRLDVDDLKPAVRALAQTVEPLRAGGARLPIVTQLRFGSGQSILVATDELWRWRYGRGEVLPEQFWIQIVRMLGRDRLAATGRGVTLTASPGRVPVGQPVVMELRVTDAELIDTDMGGLLVHILDPELGRVAEVPLVPVEGAEGRYTATWIADQPGSFTISTPDAPLNQYQLSDRITVFQPEDEMQRPEADHELLARLAEQTGGAVIPPDQVGDVLPQLLRNRAIKTQLDIVESLWDTPLCFALVLLLLTFEWVGRKLVRLV